MARLRTLSSKSLGRWCMAAWIPPLGLLGTLLLLLPSPSPGTTWSSRFLQYRRSLNLLTLDDWCPVGKLIEEGVIRRWRRSVPYNLSTLALPGLWDLAVPGLPERPNPCPQRFLSYTDWEGSGTSNHILSLLNALFLSRDSNRTLVLSVRGESLFFKLFFPDGINRYFCVAKPLRIGNDNRGNFSWGVEEVTDGAPVKVVEGQGPHAGQDIFRLMPPAGFRVATAPLVLLRPNLKIRQAVQKIYELLHEGGGYVGVHIRSMGGGCRERSELSQMGSAYRNDPSYCDIDVSYTTKRVQKMRDTAYQEYRSSGKCLAKHSSAANQANESSSHTESTSRSTAVFVAHDIPLYLRARDSQAIPVDRNPIALLQQLNSTRIPDVVEDENSVASGDNVLWFGHNSLLPPAAIKVTDLCELISEEKFYKIKPWCKEDRAWRPTGCDEEASFVAEVQAFCFVHQFEREGAVTSLGIESEFMLDQDEAAMVDFFVLTFSAFFVGNPTSTFSSNAIILRTFLGFPRWSSTFDLAKLGCYGSSEPPHEFRKKLVGNSGTSGNEWVCTEGVFSTGKYYHHYLVNISERGISRPNLTSEAEIVDDDTLNDGIFYGGTMGDNNKESDN